jgi:hypothetical protein
MFSANLFENPRGLIQMYHNFVEKVKGRKIIKRFSTTLAITKIKGDSPSEEDTIITSPGDISLLTMKIQLRPEAILFLFEVDKTAKNLFLFCVITKMDPTNLEFSWNKKDQEDFLDFCKLFGAPPSPYTVKDSMKLLVSQNLVRSFNRTIYMCNPLIVATAENVTSTLLTKYTNSIVEREKKNDKLGGVIQDKLFPKLKTLYKEVSI